MTSSGGEASCGQGPRPINRAGYKGDGFAQSRGRIVLPSQKTILGFGQSDILGRLFTAFCGSL